MRIFRRPVCGGSTFSLAKHLVCMADDSEARAARTTILNSQGLCRWKICSLLLRFEEGVSTTLESAPVWVSDWPESRNKMNRFRRHRIEVNRLIVSQPQSSHLPILVTSEALFTILTSLPE
jgi:hypothetical protein